jgi:hypothetical protein
LKILANPNIHRGGARPIRPSSSWGARFPYRLTGFLGLLRAAVHSLSRRMRIIPEEAVSVSFDGNSLGLHHTN